MTLDEQMGTLSSAAGTPAVTPEASVLKPKPETCTSKPPMPKKCPSILDRLADVTGTLAQEWQILDGPDSRVGIDYWYRHRTTGVEAYLNLDQDHLTISVAGERVYEGLHSSVAQPPEY